MQLQVADLDDVAGAQRALAGLDAVHQDAISAAEIADEDVMKANHELGVSPRKERISVAHIASRVAPDDHPARQEQFVLAATVDYEQLFAHAGSILKRAPGRTAARRRVPAGSSSVIRAVGRPLANRNGASDSITRTTMPSRSTNSTSIGNRMNHV